MIDEARLALAGLAVLVGCSAPRDDDQPGGTAPGMPAPGSAGSPGAAGAVPLGSGAASGAPTTSMGGGSSGNVAGTPASGNGGSVSDAGSAGAAPMPPTDACDFSYQQLVDVDSAQGLANALGSAAPGTLIRLADGEIRGAFKSGKSGSAAQPIVLCGTRQAVLSGPAGEAVLTLEGDYWVASGFSVRGGQKGVLLDGANHNVLRGLSVSGTGNEAVHFRSASSDNVLEWSEISDTGAESPEFGEGVYIGSAVSQWQKFTGSAGTPDRSDRNAVRNNTIGPGVRAELVDIKEGTTGGVIQDNTLNGAGIVSDGFADSWIDVKGNGYSILGNQGADSPADGFQVHVVEGGWGTSNAFRRNRATVNADGYGFRISDDASGTVVACDNVVMGAGAGLSNIGCQN